MNTLARFKSRTQESGLKLGLYKTYKEYLSHPL